jgi:hypothetical protein
MHVQSDLWGARPPSTEAGNRTFYPPRAPFIKHSRTSRDAACDIEPHLNELQTRVLKYLRWRREGATDEEIQDALAMSPSTQRPRRIELCQKRLVKDSGRKRKTRSGRSAVVWMATSWRS